MRLFARQVMPDPDLEGFHSFPSIYHLHLHLMKGRPTHPKAVLKHSPTYNARNFFHRPLPVEEYLCHFAPADVIENLLEQGTNMQDLQRRYTDVSRLHPLDQYVPALAHLFHGTYDANKALAVSVGEVEEAEAELINATMDKGEMADAGLADGAELREEGLEHLLITT